MDLGKYKGTSVGPGRGLQLSHTSPHHPDRLLFIGHHGAYEVTKINFVMHLGQKKIRWNWLSGH